MTAQMQRDLAQQTEPQQMTAQLPCFEYYAAPRVALEDPTPAQPSPSLAALAQMYGYYD